MTWAQIGSSSGFRYQLTDADVLWASRMASYEGGDAARALWTLTQRFVLQNRHDSFGDFLQHFSQPINSAWRRDGEFCRPGGRYYGQDNCSEARLARRDAAANATMEDLRRRNSRAVDTVMRWATATLQNPVPRAVDFADPSVAAHWLARNAGQVVDRVGNWFLATAESLTWDANHVFMRLGKSVANAETPAKPSNWLWWVLGGGAALGAGWWVWKHRRA